MTPEEKSLLERTYKLAEENNKILRGLRRSNRTAIALRALYWVVIIALSYGAIYFIQPYFNTLTSMLGQNGGISGLTSDLSTLQEAANQLKAVKK